MDLFPYEQRRLDGLDGELRAEEPGLASKFDVFARLAREDGTPPAERQFMANGRWRDAAAARRRWRLALMVAVVLAVLSALAAVTVLGFA